MEKVKQFLEITNCDSEEIANYYLGLCDGDLENAIGMMYEDVGLKDDFKDKLTVLEWNIQGLLDDCLSQRMQAIISIIKQHQPSVIMLQEVIQQTYLYLQSVLGPKFKSFSPIELSGECAPYFTAIFVDTAKLSPSKPTVIPFPTSKQCRQILTVKTKFGNREVVLMTSHLESTREGSVERKNQLAILYNNMIQAQKDCTVIFGGDTNLRDYEYNSVVSSGKFDTNVVNDVWSMLGSPQDSRYSWDLVKNDNQIKDGQARLRFERLYTVVEKESNKNIFKPQNCIRPSGGYHQASPGTAMSQCSFDSGPEVKWDNDSPTPAVWKTLQGPRSSDDDESGSPKLPRAIRKVAPINLASVNYPLFEESKRAANEIIEALQRASKESTGENAQSQHVRLNLTIPEMDEEEEESDNERVEQDVPFRSRNGEDLAPTIKSAFSTLPVERNSPTSDVWTDDDIFTEELLSQVDEELKLTPKKQQTSVVSEQEIPRESSTPNVKKCNEVDQAGQGKHRKAKSFLNFMVDTAKPPKPSPNKHKTRILDKKHPDNKHKDN